MKYLLHIAGVVFFLMAAGSFSVELYTHPSSPSSLTQADKAPAPRTKYTDDIDSFVTYDLAPKDRAAALLGAQRAVTWMENHGAIDYYPPSEGDSP